MKKRIYTDTSVIGGCLDAEFEEGSNKLFTEFIEGRSILLISDLTIDELAGAPKEVRNIVAKVPVENVKFLEISTQAKELAQTYIDEKVVSKNSLADAQHIAIATLCHADVLVSWNFKHIVNLDRINGYNAVNLKSGYKTIEIRTPIEVLKYEI